MVVVVVDCNLNSINLVWSKLWKTFCDNSDQENDLEYLFCGCLYSLDWTTGLTFELTFERFSFQLL